MWSRSVRSHPVQRSSLILDSLGVGDRTVKLLDNIKPMRDPRSDLVDGQATQNGQLASDGSFAPGSLHQRRRGAVYSDARGSSAKPTVVRRRELTDEAPRHALALRAACANAAGR